MADKMRSTTVTLSFAPLGLFPSAFKCCFQTGASPRSEKRRFGGFLLQLHEHPTLSKPAAEVREAHAEDSGNVGPLPAIGVHHDRKQIVHSTYENAPHPLFIGVRCFSAVKKWVNSRPHQRPPCCKQPNHQRIQDPKALAPSRMQPNMRQCQIGPNGPSTQGEFEPIC